MFTTLLLLWILSGGMIASAIMIRVWLHDPPPGGGIGRFLGVLIGGLVGGALAGYATHSLSSDPMPGIIGALGGGAILSAIVTVFTRRAGP